MAIKLNALSRWNLLPSDGLISFADAGNRLVRLQLNCEAETALYIKFAGVPARFLATVPAGLETLEFYVEGAFQIGPPVTDGPAIQWQTAESEKTVVLSTGETFTKMHERQPRNEALEYVMFMSEQNAKRREEALRAEFADQLRAMRTDNGEKAGIHGRKAPKREERKPDPEGAAEDGPDPDGDGQAPVRGSEPDKAVLEQSGARKAAGGAARKAPVVEAKE